MVWIHGVSPAFALKLRRTSRCQDFLSPGLGSKQRLGTPQTLRRFSVDFRKVAGGFPGFLFGSFWSGDEVAAGRPFRRSVVGDASAVDGTAVLGRYASRLIALLFHLTP